MGSAGVVRAAAGAVCALAAVGLSGCGVPRSASGSTVPTGDTNSVSGGGPAAEPAAGSVDPAGVAQQWTVTPGPRTSLSGALANDQQVHTYDIGPVYTGERLLVEARAAALLDPVVAILDAGQNVLVCNDDRNYYAGQTDSLAEVFILQDSPHCYVALASSPDSHTSGGYALELALTEISPPVAPAAQRIYLNFEGAREVRIGGRPPVDIPRFSGSRIDPRFTDQTDQIADTLLAMVEQDFTGLNVEFHSSRLGPPPAEPYTTIHFGAYDPDLLGVAENIDEYNERPSQQAIIFVDTFAAFAVVDPSAEEIAQALANVTSHECGHLLGLYHCSDPRAIMDITATLQQMLVDQSFLRARLHAEVFPSGYQDALALLAQNVGGDLEAARRAAKTQQAFRVRWADQDQGPPARSTLVFSSRGH